MKKIKDMVELIQEELEGAKNYAEKYLECKAEGNTSRAGKLRDMSNEELGHAQFIHEIAVEEIQKLNTVFISPLEMEEKWQQAHKEYVENFAWIKQMLTM